MMAGGSHVVVNVLSVSFLWLAFNFGSKGLWLCNLDAFLCIELSVGLGCLLLSCFVAIGCWWMAMYPCWRSGTFPYCQDLSLVLISSNTFFFYNLVPPPYTGSLDYAGRASVSCSRLGFVVLHPSWLFYFIYFGLLFFYTGTNSMCLSLLQYFILCYSSWGVTNLSKRENRYFVFFLYINKRRVKAQEKNYTN